MFVKKKIINPVIILLTSFIGGYTVANFPKKFLELFTLPLGQFIAFSLILYLFYYEDKTVSLNDILLESVIYVIILQVLKYVLCEIYE